MGDTALAMVHSVQPMVADDIVTVASRTLRKKQPEIEAESMGFVGR